MQASEPVQDLRVKPHVFVKVIGYGSILLFTFAAFMSWLTGGGIVSPFLLLFALLGVLCLLLYGPIEADEYVITSILPVGHFEIRWDELIYVEVDGYALVFVGDEKRLPIAGPTFWAQENKEAMIELITAQIEKRQIPLRYSRKASYRLPKNTRVD
jgi:hypothetical protein